jgi:hypothetical protein
MVDSTLHPPRRLVGAPSAWAWGLFAVAAPLIAVASRLVNLGAYTGSFDEGVRAQQLLLMSAGYRPFRDIFASQGVLLLDLLYPFFWLGGESLLAARLGVVTFSLLGLGAAYWAGRAFSGRLAASIALGLLLLSPLYLQGSRLALAEVPSLVPAVFALAMTLSYVRHARWELAVLAVLGATIAVLVKPMAVAVLPAVAAGMLMHGRAGLRDLMRGALLAAAVTAVTVIAMGPYGVYEQLVAYRGGAAGAFSLRSIENARLARQAISTEGWGILVGATAGTLVALRTMPRLAVAPIVWAAASFTLILCYNDLSEKHLVYMVPPLVLLACAGPPAAWIAWSQRKNLSDGVSGTVLGRLRATAQSQGKGGLLTLVVASVGVLAYAITLPTALHQMTQIVWPDAASLELRRDRASEIELTSTFRRLAGPGEFVVSDNPLAAFDARRLVPPWLADPSGTRVDAGSLTAPLIIEQVRQYRPLAVATWRGRTGKLEDYIAWLDTNYVLIDTFGDGEWRVYAASDAPA